MLKLLKEANANLLVNIKHMPIAWSDDLSVNVKEIDDQHQVFLGILNNLYDVAHRIEERDELANILRQLVAYAAFHFATEEKYFDKFDYEWADEHKEGHRELLARALKFKERYAAEGEEVLVELVEFLEDWLREHLTKEDKKYTKCFNNHGLF